MYKAHYQWVPGLALLFLAQYSQAGVEFETPQGKLSIGGNFEFNLDLAHLNTDVLSGTDTYDNSGRVELNINGEHTLANGMYSAFSLNPGWLIGGDAINDMWMGVGQKDNWFFKMGHYLAYDVAPVGLGPGDDTMVLGYEMYTVNDARGRASNMASFNKWDGNFYYEVTAVYADDFNDHESTLNTLPGQNTDADDYLFDGSGITSVKKRDPLILRPVMAWTGDKIQAGVGGEFSMVSDAYVDETTGASLYDRDGIGGYVSYVFSSDWSGLLRTAYLKGFDHTQYTAGLGLKYRNIYLGYLFGREDVDSDSRFSGMAHDKSADAHEIYISSVWKNFLYLSNMEFHAGGYWTQVNANDQYSSELAKDTDYGVRLRLKYWF